MRAATAPGTRSTDLGRRPASARITAGTLRLAALLAVAGGFLDSFTYIAHGGVFANAQTGNVVLLGVLAARGDWIAAGQHALPILAFVVGVATAETLSHSQ
jgi:uncharacterized membrane protein YoaK (UPF0700 family)